MVRYLVDLPPLTPPVEGNNASTTASANQGNNANTTTHTKEENENPTTSNTTQEVNENTENNKRPQNSSNQFPSMEEWLGGGSSSSVLLQLKT